ncbi:MAG TPA: carbohydrate binding domain-containing protein [Verrucomicrobiae bacterium]|nr:carbohydrate binding domain-containing protein [Verrucomicrobiae bacterium]
MRAAGAAILAAGVLLSVAWPVGAAVSTNLVMNGSFEEDSGGDGVPDGWSASGSSEVEQKFGSDAGSGGGRCAKLACTRFGKQSPSTHAMICQVGKVGLVRGTWYRLTFRARGEGIKGGTVSVGISRTRPWGQVALGDTFFVGSEWDRFEFLFRAKEDLQPDVSRLQFYYYSTGALWLDDVELVETDERPRWLPEIPSESRGNLIPNSSFECGGANWGSVSVASGSWGQHAFRLEGDVVGGRAPHGERCLQISLGAGTSPVMYFDYFDPVERPLRQALAANVGWFRAKRGERFTFSVWLKADAPGTVARMAAIYPEGRLRRHDVAVGTEWQRHEFSFDAEGESFFVAAGLDLDASKRDAAILWVDAVQLERGGKSTAYSPRRTVETFVSSPVIGNIHTRPEAGLALDVRAYNDGEGAARVRGKISVTDFADALAGERELDFAVPAKGGAFVRVGGVASGKRGFFRASWVGDGGTNALRCAVIESCAGIDSPIGMNHAYPWDWMLQLAHLGGISWWRDWSVKWGTVEPEPERWDFSQSDPQIDRIVRNGGRALVLLPFPSAPWASRYSPREKDPPAESQQGKRLRVAEAAKDTSGFGRYAAAAADHYRDRTRTFHILNEPLFTDYALPMSRGYKLDDYLDHLGMAALAIRGVDRGLQVAGGIAQGPGAALVQEFVARGGLGIVDVVDLHMYPPPVPAESHEEDFAALERLMGEHGGAKPIWITEFGCYADDDPACVPLVVGDATMNRCRWRSEALASEQLVKFVAVSFAHGVRKIFLHAGVCGPLNGSDSASIFFEYGGAPRKMYPAVAALTAFLGSPESCTKTVSEGGLHGYAFKARAGAVAIAWADKPRPIGLPDGVDAFDIMGNHVVGREVSVGRTPLYVVHKGGDVGAVVRALSAAR